MMSKEAPKTVAVNMDRSKFTRQQAEKLAASSWSAHARFVKRAVQRSSTIAPARLGYKINSAESAAANLSQLARDHSLRSSLARRPAILQSPWKRQQAVLEAENKDRVEANRDSMGSGRSLDAAVRRYLEPYLGFNMAKVRIHTGGENANHVRKAGADAITFGNHLFFGPGKFATNHPKGRALLVHELTHVRQQQMPIATQTLSANQRTQFEREALTNESAAGQHLASVPDVTPTDVVNQLSQPKISYRKPPAPRQSQIVPMLIQSPEGGKTPMAALASRELGLVAATDTESESSQPATFSAFEVHSVVDDIYDALMLRLKTEKERLGN